MQAFVLVRGLIRDQRHWGSFTSALQQTFPSMPILTFDLPGVGVLANRPAPRSIPEMAEALEEQWQQHSQGIQQIHLVAMSLGSMAGFYWSERFPERFRSRIFINGSASNLSPMFDRFQFQWIPKTLKTLLSPTPRNIESLILEATSNVFATDPALLGQRLQWHQEIPVQTKVFVNQMIAGARFKMGKTKSAAPTLILNSPKDRLVNARCSEQIAKFQNWPLRAHPTGGHDLPLDQPQWVAENIKNFLFEQQAIERVLPAPQK